MNHAVARLSHSAATMPEPITRKEKRMECEEFMEPEQDVEYDDDQ